MLGGRAVRVTVMRARGAMSGVIAEALLEYVVPHVVEALVVVVARGYCHVKF